MSTTNATPNATLPRTTADTVYQVATALAVFLLLASFVQM